jgi:putative zinc finger/helix-turn-helix YgiT family protein
MPVPIDERRCHVCHQRTLRRVQRPYEFDFSHDGRPPVRIRIPDLEVVACTNPDCHPADPSDTIIETEETARRIDEETARQLGLLTPAEIRAGREHLGLTQRELQELLGLGGNSLSRWECGQVFPSRSLDSLLRIIFAVPEALVFLRSRPRRVSA